MLPRILQQFLDIRRENHLHDSRKPWESLERIGERPFT